MLCFGAGRLVDFFGRWHLNFPRAILHFTYAVGKCLGIERSGAKDEWLAQNIENSLSEACDPSFTMAHLAQTGRGAFDNLIAPIAAVKSCNMLTDIVLRVR